MELIFKPYLDNFYTAISGFWCLTNPEVKEMLKGLPDNILDTSFAGKPPIKFNMYELVGKLPTVPFQICCRGNNYIIMQARFLIIACYESIKDILKEDQKWSQIQHNSLMKVFRHVRNAATHDNHFDIKYEKDLKYLPLSWRTKTINLNTIGKELFFGWLAVGDIEYFLEDISEELIRLRKNNLI